MCVAPVRRSENSGARPGGPRKGGKWELRIGTSRWPVHPMRSTLVRAGFTVLGLTGCMRAENVF